MDCECWMGRTTQSWINATHSTFTFIAQGQLSRRSFSNTQMYSVVSNYKNRTTRYLFQFFSVQKKLYNDMYYTTKMRDVLVEKQELNFSIEQKVFHSLSLQPNAWFVATCTTHCYASILFYILLPDIFTFYCHKSHNRSFSIHNLYFRSFSHHFFNFCFNLVFRFRYNHNSSSRKTKSNQYFSFQF